MPSDSIPKVMIPERLKSDDVGARAVMREVATTATESAEDTGNKIPESESSTPSELKMTGLIDGEPTGLSVIRYCSCVDYQDVYYVPTCPYCHPTRVQSDAKRSGARSALRTLELRGIMSAHGIAPLCASRSAPIILCTQVQIDECRKKRGPLPDHTHTSTFMGRERLCNILRTFTSLVFAAICREFPGASVVLNAQTCLFSTLSVLKSLPTAQ
jgi:hypothetical protein